MHSLTNRFTAPMNFAACRLDIMESRKDKDFVIAGRNTNSTVTGNSKNIVTKAWYSNLCL